MFVQSRETLPVAGIDLERRIQVAKEISDEIALSTYNLENLSMEGMGELEKEFALVQRHIGELAARQASLRAA